MSSSRKMNLENPFPGKVKKIGIVSLASQPDAVNIEKTLAALEQLGIATCLGHNVYQKGLDKVLPAELQLRADDLQKCWLDQSVDLIISSRGGYGSAQLCDIVNWKKLAKRRIPVLGYSDITAFHLAMIKYGAGIPVSSPVATQLHEVCREKISAGSLKCALDHAFSSSRKISNFADLLPQLAQKKIKVLKDGKTQGKLIPVNLTVFASLIGTEHLPDIRGSILMLEDVNEPLYKLDRCFTQLQQAGLFAECSGLIFADFRRCGATSGKEKIFMKFASQINGPVLSGVPFGHLTPPLSFCVGKKIFLQT